MGAPLRTDAYSDHGDTIAQQQRARTAMRLAVARPGLFSSSQTMSGTNGVKSRYMGRMNMQTARITPDPPQRHSRTSRSGPSRGPPARDPQNPRKPGGAA